MRVQKNKETYLHRQLREFVQNYLDRNYAAANANLTAVVNEKVKMRIKEISKEIQ